ncbi:hypothetical protein ACFL15_00695 [Patescibacteria group bacterium]
MEKNISIPKKNINDNELEIYMPEKEIDYALEVNAGFSEKYNIKPNDLLDLSSLEI